MSDKDLLVIISEMLRKQDQQSEKLDQHSAILNQQSANINELKDTLKQFIDVSVQHFEKQDGFNIQFLSN